MFLVRYALWTTRSFRGCSDRGRLKEPGIRVRTSPVYRDFILIRIRVLRRKYSHRV